MIERTLLAGDRRPALLAAARWLEPEAEALRAEWSLRRSTEAPLSPGFVISPMAATMRAMRTRRLLRCLDCGLSPNLCICNSLPTLHGPTQIVIVAHRTELAKTTNTGRLVARMLAPRAELIIADATTQPSAADGSWVLFPSEDAQPLASVGEHVHTLIVPDGTWAQTRRITRRHPRCAALARVKLVAPPRSRYQLRHNRDQAGLCTLEAVAYALRQLEGESSAGPLLAAFAAWQERAVRVRHGAHEQRAPCELDI